MEKRVGKTEYDSSIQGLRGLAIILIIVSHMFGKYNLLGGFGTAIFVAISGYVACKNNRAEERLLSGNQKLYRIAKLYPLYFLVTCITAIYFNPEIVYGVSRTESITAFVFNVFMIQTYVPKSSFFGAFSQVGWYMPFVVLSILCANLICRLWRRIHIKSSVLLMAVFTGLYFAVIASGWEKANWLIYFSPVFRLMEYVLGGCVFIIVDELGGEEKYSRIKGLALLLIFTVILGALSIGLNLYSGKALYMRILWWYLPTWYLLALNYRFKLINKIFENGLLVFIGNISFELFLIHLMVIKAVEVLTADMNMTGAIVKILSAILIVISAYLINRLDNIWKNKAYGLICLNSKYRGIK